MSCANGSRIKGDNLEGGKGLVLVNLEKRVELLLRNIGRKE